MPNTHDFIDGSTGGKQVHYSVYEHNGNVQRKGSIDNVLDDLQAVVTVQCIAACVALPFVCIVRRTAGMLGRIQRLSEKVDTQHPC